MATYTTSQLCSTAYTPLLPYVTPAAALVIGYPCIRDTLQQYAASYKECRAFPIKIPLIYKSFLWLSKLQYEV